MPSHTHGFEVSGSWSGSSIATDNGTKYEPDYIESTSVGGNQPHNNMPPYLAVYAWKRTA